MSLFLGLYLKIIPIYLALLLGFVARRFFNVNTSSFHYVISYFIIPLVILDVTLHVEIEEKYFVLPILIFLTSLLIGLFYYFIGKKIWNDGKERLIASMSGSSNIYIGLFIVLSLFEHQITNLFLLVSTGLILYDITIGLYLLVGNISTPSKLLISKLKLPSILSVIIG